MHSNSNHHFLSSFFSEESNNDDNDDDDLNIDIQDWLEDESRISYENTADD